MAYLEYNGLAITPLTCACGHNARMCLGRHCPPRCVAGTLGSAASNVASIDSKNAISRSTQRAGNGPSQLPPCLKLLCEENTFGMGQ